MGQQALEVGGAGDHVEVDDVETLQFSAFDSYSVTAWIRPTGGGGWRGVVTKGREAAPWYGIWLEPASEWIYGTQPNNLYGPAAEIGAWTHVAIVQDGELGTRELWVDGQLEATDVSYDATSFTPLFIGGAGGVDGWFVGTIDEVRVYDEALDAGGIEESMGPPPECADPPDTHCKSVSVVDRDGSEVKSDSVHPAGKLAVSIEAEDDGGDSILYTVSADNGVDPPVIVSSPGDPNLTLNLPSGSWTLSVSVDDDSFCDDVAGDASCASLTFSLEPQPPAGLVHYWDFEDEFGDVEGGLGGDPVGNAALTDDARIGEQALEVSGGGDHVEVPDAESLHFTALDSYSVTAWIKTTGGGGWRGVVTKGREAAPWYGIWLEPGSRWVYGTQPNNLLGPTTEPDTWTHVAIVQNGDLGTRELFVGGRLEGMNVAYDATSFTPLFIGGAGGVDEWFTGVIDDVRVYATALDAEGVVQSMDAISGTNPPTPLFVRGNSDGVGNITINDGIFVLNYLFLGGGDPSCKDAADSDDSGGVNINDAIYILNFLFLGGPDPLPPYPDCGADPTEDATDCMEAHAACAA